MCTIPGHEEVVLGRTQTKKLQGSNSQGFSLPAFAKTRHVNRHVQIGIGMNENLPFFFFFLRSPRQILCLRPTLRTLHMVLRYNHA